MARLRQTWRGMALITLGTGLGGILNAVSPHPLRLNTAVLPASASGNGICSAGGAEITAHPEHRSMSREDAIAACSSCSAGFVDARGAAAYARGHIPNAIHLPPLGHPAEADALSGLRGFSAVVVYGDTGPGCDLATSVADRLSEAGLRDVRILEGGWMEWQAAGGPAESGACQACVRAASPGEFAADAATGNQP